MDLDNNAKFGYQKDDINRIINRGESGQPYKNERSAVYLMHRQDDY